MKDKKKLDALRLDITPLDDKLPSTRGESPHPVKTVEHGDEIRHIEIARIKVDPNQPRKAFRESSLMSLAESIKEKGVLQPVILIRVGDGSFSLTVGERRYHASKLAGKETIPAIVLDSIGNVAEIQLIENTQREDLLPEEIARALRNQMREKNYSHDYLSMLLNKSKPTVSKYLKVAEFIEHDGVYDFIAQQRGSEGYNIGLDHLYEASCCPDVKAGLEMLADIFNNNLTTKGIRVKKAKGSTVALTEKTLIHKFRFIRKKLDLHLIDSLPKDISSNNLILAELEKTYVHLSDYATTLKTTIDSIKG